MRDALIHFLDRIKDYEHESGHSMYEDERESSEIVDIHLEAVPELKNYVFISHVSVSVLEEIRQAFSNYYRSEGCSCCRNEKEHDKAEEKLAEILKPDKYEDGSGYDWYKYASTER
jgi:hypothetical protein